MKFHYISSFEKRPQSDGLVVPCCAKDGGGFLALHPLPEEILEQLDFVGSLKDFSAKKGEMLSLYHKGSYASRLILVGLGEEKQVDGEVLRESYAKLMVKSIQKKLHRLVVLLPDIMDRKPSRVIQALMEGMVYGGYRFSRYKEQEGTLPEIFIPYHSLEEFLLLDQRIQSFQKALTAVRDVVNMNADEKNPEGFGRYFLNLLQGTGLQSCLYDEKWLEKEKMGLILAVGKGAESLPRMLVISWQPVPSDTDHTLLVGKGVTFDSGGLNLKPSGSIETMKCDMAGGAVAAGVMLALSELNVQKNVTAVIPLAENGIGSRAFKPGDVLHARSGQTVEITNTDAEGRLLLADAVAWAESELHPTRIFDIATLTGACEVALGTDIFALFSNSDALAFELEQAAKRAGESLWRMPLHVPYRDLLKSDIADCKNGPSTRLGGAISGALFIERFIHNTPWVHMDIAGTAFSKDGKSYYGKGATGSPLRTLLEFFMPSV